MAGRNRKTSAIKDIDELEKEQKIEEKVEEPKEDIQTEPEVKAEPKSVNLKKVMADPFLNVRNKPSMVGSEIIGKVFTGDIVDIVTTKDGFAKISETEEKWVSMDYLVPVYSKEQLEK